MDKVLNWAVAQQSGDKDVIARAGTPDPKILNQLFGGVDEVALMKQAIIIVQNPEATLENKEIAFENFLMLIEDLDNANNIENLKMWPAIVSQLKDTSIPLLLRETAASIIGVSVQNNPKSQEAFVKDPEGMSVLIDIASNKASTGKLLLKSISALSSLLNNCKDAFKSFLLHDGFKLLSLAKSDDSKLLLRVCVLVGAIISTGIDADKEAALRKHNFIDIFQVVLNKGINTDTIDLALNSIGALKSNDYKFTDTELNMLREGLDRVSEMKHQLSEDDFDAASKAIK